MTLLYLQNSQIPKKKCVENKQTCIRLSCSTANALGDSHDDFPRRWRSSIELLFVTLQWSEMGVFSYQRFCAQTVLSIATLDWPRIANAITAAESGLAPGGVPTSIDSDLGAPLNGRQTSISS